MKKVLLGIGAAVIAVLLLLQTRFSEIEEVYSEGYAVMGESVRQMLSINPNDGIEITHADLYHFQPLDKIYSRGNKFYFGENEKTLIDLSFPFLINGGSGVQFTDENVTLFDEEFDKSSSYSQLRIIDGYSYNLDGSQADPVFYIFGEMGNGFFVNFDFITFVDKGEDRTIPPNSFISFKQDYFSYVVLENDALVYRTYKNVHDWSPIWVGEEKYTYYDLLIKLGVLTPLKNPSQNTLNRGEGQQGDNLDNEEYVYDESFANELENETEPEETEQQLTDKDSQKQQNTTNERPTVKDRNKDKDKVKDKDRNQNPNKKPGKQPSGNKEETKEENNKKPSIDKKPVPKPEIPERPAEDEQENVPKPRPPKQPGNNSGDENQSIGVRPDEMRPDKLPTEDGDGSEDDIQYDMPTVTVSNLEGKVYRILFSVNASDPAGRLHPRKQIQFEFYEQLDNGKEKLAYRTFATGSKQGVAGGGAIKPATKYRMVGYFTYYDNNDKETVESIIDTYIETQDLSVLGSVTLSNSDNGISIPYYYDNRLEIPNLTFDMEVSDEEAVYGISQAKGMHIEVNGTGRYSSIHSEENLEANKVRLIKGGASVNWVTSPGLKANGNYSYEITLQDYFGNPIELTNPRGDFETSKARPVGQIEIVNNEIADVKAKLKITDEDLSAIPVTPGSNEYDIYFVVMGQADTQNNPLTKEECDQYVPGTSTPHNIEYVYKLQPSDYQSTNESGEVVIKVDGLTRTMDKLKLAKKYHAYLYMDFDLHNGMGAVRFDKIGSFIFTSASLNSLGRVYLQVGTADITAHTADIVFKLNAAKTNSTLASLISDVSVQVVRGAGEEPITDISYDLPEVNISDFKTGSIGYHISTEAFANHPLKSMCEYKVTSTILGLYDDEKYELEVEIEGGTFKTLREPATVTIDNVLLAAGTLRFDAQILDPDDAICGNTGHKVVLNVYEGNGKLITATRVEKNTEQPVSLTFQNMPNKVMLSFVAQEYNEGYTNLTYESNKIIKEFTIHQTLNVSGSIKLKDLKDSGNSLTAQTYVTLEDQNKFMLTVPYYVKVEEDGVDVSSRYAQSYQVVNSNYEKGVARQTISFASIQKGSHTYKMTLYLVVNSQKLVLDTLEFTSEEDIIEISTVPEFIWLTYHYPDKKFVVTADLLADMPRKPELSDFTDPDLYPDEITKQIAFQEALANYEEEIKNIDPYLKSNTAYKCPICHDSAHYGDLPTASNACAVGSTATKSMARHLDTFKGKIDFQGFTLKYAMMTQNPEMFTRLDETAEIYNMVADVQIRAAMRWGGLVCGTNYGHIHDVYVRYTGGSRVATRDSGLITYLNATSGLIENFVVANDPQDDMIPLTAHSRFGLVCDLNGGTIRNGYAYGDNIYADINKTAVTSLDIGGIAGYQYNTGRIQNVYSLVNVYVPDKDKSSDGKTESIQYGSVVGYGTAGRLENSYGIGQSVKISTNGAESVNYAFGPVSGGGVNNRNKNIYYWFDTSKSYANDTYKAAASAKQKAIGIETLYDYSWQRNLLGGKFDTTPVEVGYYPHVKLSSEMPSQPLISLPNRNRVNPIEFVSANLIEYQNDGEEAYMSFRFSNTKKYQITELLVDGLECELNLGTLRNEDGYTTVEGVLKNPTKFTSTYEIEGVKYENMGKALTVEFKPKPILMVDFYRRVSNANEWYEYVVKKPTENARVVADIDFTGVDKTKIRVTSNYSGKLIGSLDSTGVGYKLMNITIKGSDSTKDRATLFDYLDYSGEIRNLCIENVELTNKETPITNCSLVLNDYGYIENVHVKDIEIKDNYGYMGGIVAYQRAGTTVRNCSVTNLTIRYKEPANTIVEGGAGGITGNLSEAYIENCFARNVNINLIDISDCGGAGGVVGRVGTGVIDGAYATGKMEVRGVNAGGVIGYFAAANYRGTITNILGKVDIICHQDMVGGLIGTSSNTEILNGNTGYSGIALGNVSCKNPSSENISYTIGALLSNNIYMYGSREQLRNGLPFEAGLDKTDDKYMLTKEQLLNPATYTTTARMGNSYDYSVVEQGIMPKLYYMDTTTLLPFQEDVELFTQVENLITVEKIYINKTDRIIILEINRPANCKVTGVTVNNLAYDYLYSDSASVDFQRLYLQYKPENQQAHYFDSYDVTGINYELYDSEGNRVETSYCDYSQKPIVVPLTLYGTIANLDNWNACFSSEKNYGNYENYQVTNSISFSSSSIFGRNIKVGRLIGASRTGTIVLSDINLGTSKAPKAENLILCVGSELGNLVFKNVDIHFKGRANSGLIGFSTAKIHDVEFRNVQVDAYDNNSFCGTIGKQSNGAIENVVLQDVFVNKRKVVNPYYTGALMGCCSYKATVKNITANNLYVRGGTYLGGLVGYSSRSSYNNINVSDVKVTSRNSGNYHSIGGVIGRVDVGYDGERSPQIGNITLTGTPTYDSNGNITGSTTEIYNTKEGELTGGVIGYSVAGQVGYVGAVSTATIRDTANARPIRVSGVVVRSGGNNTGGAFGQGNYIGNVIVQDSLVTNYTPEGKSLSTAQRYNFGGVAGYNGYTSACFEAERVTVKTTNVHRVGGIAGRSYGGSIASAYVTDCKILADASLNYTFENVGGLVGLAEGAMYSSIVENTIVDAPKHNNVGGITGYSNNTVERCVYYAEPKTAPTDTYATSSDKYYVRGKYYVGGIEGVRNTGTVWKCSSNANVIALERYAGGISGLYNNRYYQDKVNGKTTYSYSYSYMRYNMFSGSVYAKQNAGGAMGGNSMSMTWVYDYLNQNLDIARRGGRTTDKVNGSIASGASHEYNYTYMNLIIADRIVTQDGDGYAFSGTQDGFEGDFNTYNVKSAASSGSYIRKPEVEAHPAEKYHARISFFWAGTQIGTISDIANWNRETVTNPTTLYQMKVNNVEYKYPMWIGKNLTTAERDKAPADKVVNDRNSQFGFNETLNQCCNVRLFTSEDLKKTEFWYAIGFRTSGYRHDPSMKNEFTRLLLKDKGTDAEYAAMNKSVPGDTLRYKAQDLLPHIRLNSGAGGLISDLMTNRQSDRQLDLPIPVRKGINERVTGTPTPLSLRNPVVAEENVEEEEEETSTTSNSTSRAGQSDLVIGYAVDVDKVTLEFADALYQADLPYALYYGTELVEEGKLEEQVLSFSYDFKRNIRIVIGEEEYSLRALSLSLPIMTYGNEFAYISQEGIIHGSQGNITSTLEGEFIHIQKGKALAKDGSIWDILTGEAISSVNGMERISKTPLEAFGTEGMLVKTYGNFTEISDSEGNTLTRPVQLLASVNGAAGSVPGRIKNIKNAVVLHEGQYTTHVVTLGQDGMIADLYDSFGEEFILPEDFVNKGIVHITNNLDTTLPYMLAEYSNGSMVGINYLTGEYLFNHYQASAQSFLDYVKHYFDGDKSELANVSTGYTVQNAIVQMAGTPSNLQNMVSTGNVLPDDTEKTGTDGEKHDSLNQNKEKQEQDTASKDESLNGEIPSKGTATDSADSPTDSPENAESDKSSVGSSQQLEGLNTEIVGEADIKGNSLSNGTSMANGEYVPDQDEVSGENSKETLEEVLGENSGGHSSKNSEENRGERSEESSGNSNENSEQNLGLNSSEGAEQTAGENSGEGSGESSSDTKGNGTLTQDGHDQATFNRPQLEGSAHQENSGNSQKENESLEVQKGGENPEAEEQQDVEKTPDGEEAQNAGETKNDEESKNGDESEKDKSTESDGSLEKDSNANADSDEGSQDSEENQAQVSVHDTTANKLQANANSENVEGNTEGTEGDSDTEGTEDSVELTVEDAHFGKLMTVYNVLTGSYEIVDMSKYLTKPNYVSENDSLNIKNFADVIDTSIAQGEKEEDSINGLILYILVALAITVGIVLTMRYKKRK